ncbi:MAG: YqiA/YcfP family alpha/beta fold hydrolase [Candidatus Hodarchaeales archaeon]|jgi:pimeloyl-ACP methyl ester carboxylesterase
MRILYLYGFASGPESDKTQFFENKFSSLSVPFDIFDYIPDKESFKNLRTSKLLENLHSYIRLNYHEDDLILFGSSFGGFLLAYYANRHPEKIRKLILIAPALGFSASRILKILKITPSIWKEQGFVPVFHYRYNQEIPLSYSFYEDLATIPPPNFEKMITPIPTLILHGMFDEVVPLLWSQQFADNNQQVTLHELNGDHQLLDQKEKMWEIVKVFLNI